MKDTDSIECCRQGTGLSAIFSLLKEILTEMRQVLPKLSLLRSCVRLTEKTFSGPRTPALIVCNFNTAVEPQPAVYLDFDIFANLKSGSRSYAQMGQRVLSLYNLSIQTRNMRATEKLDLKSIAGKEQELDSHKKKLVIHDLFGKVGASRCKTQRDDYLMD